MRLAVPHVDAVSWVTTSETPKVRAGDVILVRHAGIVPSLIRLFERLRRPRLVPRTLWRRYCEVNHAAVVVREGLDPLIVQMAGRGGEVTPLRGYRCVRYAVVSLTATDAQRLAAVEFAQECTGTGYGFAQIVADAVNAALGVELSLGVGNRMVCSTATARAAERMGLIPDRSPAAVTPAHLAAYFHAAYRGD